MDKEIERILGSIDINKRVARLRDLYHMVVRTTVNSAEQIIRDLSIGKGHFVGEDWSGSEPYYFLFEAFVHEIAQHHGEATEKASRAASLFGLWHLHWNEAMARWLLGIVYRNDAHIGKAEEELKRARDILKRLASLPQKELTYDKQKVCNSHIDTIQQQINDLPSPTRNLSLAKPRPQVEQGRLGKFLKSMISSRNTEVSAGDTHAGAAQVDNREFGAQDEPLLNYLGSSMIIVNRPGTTDRLIGENMIPQAIKENATIVFPLYLSGGKFDKCPILDESEIIPKQTYIMKRESQNNDAHPIMYLRRRLHKLGEREKKIPIVVILDIIQRWHQDLETQVRYLIQEATFHNLSIWIHSPLFLIPTDLLPTIGTIMIIQPSRSEIRLLAEQFPGDLEADLKMDTQRLFYYNKRSGKGWENLDYSP